MTWTVENSKNDESSKVRWEIVPYMHGRMLDIGCGPYKVLPWAIGVDSGHHWGMMGVDVRVEDGAKLDLFTSQSCDTVYSSHLLEHFDYERVPAVLNEWMRVLKKGGHLILYVPDEAEYPPVGHPHANPDHRWNVNYDKVVAALEKVDYSWDMVDFQKRNQDDEYSLYFVVKKL